MFPMERADRWLVFLTLLLGLFYVSCRLSPSSYSLVLDRAFKIKETGLIAGTPRDIRSDEWSHFTPWVQATVNNNFSRYNQNSPYHEDFRTVFPMPIFDWGLFFKPFYWPFLITSPAIAYSFFWFFMTAAFVLGFHLLFRQLSVPFSLALPSALTLFFSGFVQYFWTNNAGGMALLPWVALAVVYQTRIELKIGVLIYALIAWGMALFYPPFIIQFAFFPLVLALAFRREMFRPGQILAHGIAAAAAGAVILLYFFDEAVAISQTVVPGKRVFSGGQMPLWQYLSQIFPAAIINNHESIIGSNVCEISVIGSYLPLLTLFFTDPNGFRAALSAKTTRLSWLTLFVAFAVVSIWILLPLPSIFGAPFGWNRIHPTRMGFLSGLLLTTLCTLIMAKSGVKLSAIRTTLFALVAIFVTYHSKVRAGISWVECWPELTIVVAVIAFMLTGIVWRQLNNSSHLVMAAAATNALLFAGFNPLQSTTPIFDRPESSMIKVLDETFAKQERKWLAASQSLGFPGAVLTGWGYPSIGHAIFAPPMKFWKKIFPEIPTEQLNQIFNRSGHIVVRHDIISPEALNQIVVAVPLHRFERGPGKKRKLMRSIELLDKIPDLKVNPTANGHLDTIEMVGGKLRIWGWATWNGINPQQSIAVLGAPTNTKAQILTIRRKDVASNFGETKYLDSGFVIEMEFPQATDIPAMCFLALDREAGEYFEVKDPYHGKMRCPALAATGN